MLTTETLMDVSGLGDGTLESVQVVDSGGHSLFSTSTPAFDTMLTLGAGSYQVIGLDILKARGFPNSSLDPSTFESFGADFDLEATFTAVPEPAETLPVLVAFLAAILFVSRRRGLVRYLGAIPAKLLLAE